MPPTPTASAGLPFGGILREGDVGTQPVAVKRGLFRAGNREGWDDLDGSAVAAEVLGPIAVVNLEAFQRANGLTVDGVYGPRTHAQLVPFFDAYAEFLYRPPGIHLPATFHATHQTGGLPVPGAPPGSLQSFHYPAIDVFGKPGAPVYAPCAGTVAQLSGHSPHEGGKPGGAYGWSIYLTAPHAVYFLTHFGSRNVELAQQVTTATVVGTVCDAAVAHMRSDGLDPAARASDRGSANDAP